LSSATVITVGAHDQLSGTFAASGLAKGVLTDSIGTSETLLLISGQPDLNRSLPEHGLAQGAVWVDQPVNYLTGGLFTAGSAIEWFQRELGGKADFTQLTAEAEAIEDTVPIFLPHLVRSLTPYPDAKAAGTFVGLRSTTTRAAMFRAVLEGLAFEARAIVDAIVTVGGQSRPAEIVTIGVPMQNRLLAQIKADIYGSTLKISPIREAVSLGVALLAGIGSGRGPGWPTVGSRAPRRRSRRSIVAAVVAAAALVAGGLAVGARLRDPDDLRTASLVSTTGGGIGDAVAYAGPPAWVFMRVDRALPDGTYRCVVTTDGGPPLEVGSLVVVAGQGSWGQRLAADPARLRTARLETGDGTVVAAASFR